MIACSADAATYSGSFVLELLERIKHNSISEPCVSFPQTFINTALYRIGVIKIIEAGYNALCLLLFCGQCFFSFYPFSLLCNKTQQ